MLTQIAWGFCKIAFDAAQDECFPELMRRAFRRLGSIWFWLALLLEGRALAAFCEGRRGGTRLVALKAMPARLCRRWLKPWRVPASAAVIEPAVAAWSLPNLAPLQRLGLGPVWAVRCPFCRAFHTHLPGEGRRQPACREAGSLEGYDLVYAGDLPRHLHEPFRVSITKAWPKVLLEWPQHEAIPALLKAA
jgi:hypothetical protein